MATNIIPETNVTRNIQDEWALPTTMDQVFAIEDKEYRFCVHCHTPKPVAQIVDQGPNTGICVNCVNGRNNYLRLAKRGLLTWPAAVPQPTAPAPKAPAAPAPAPAPKRVKKQDTPADQPATDEESKTQQILDLNAKRAARKK